MPNVLEVAESVVETAWQEHDLIAETLSTPVSPPRRGLRRWLAAFRALRVSPLESRWGHASQPELCAIDYLARKYPDIYILATRG
jgi:hypothetical protein